MKKFRKIVIDNDDSWAWSYFARGDYYENSTLKIWKDKKIVFEKTYGHEDFNTAKNYSITPKLISRFIKKYLKNDK